MYVYAVSNSYIDRIDPYWYCRLTGLKLAYVAVILFFVNAFFKTPAFPVLYMLVTAAGVAVSELPAINSPKKKIVAYIGVVILSITTNSVFGLISYFKWGLLIGVGIWSLMLYRLLAKNAQAANLVGALLLIGMVSLQGDVATDLNGVINHALFYLEFGIVGLIAISLFPNFHGHIVKSAALRLLEADERLLTGKLKLEAFDTQILDGLLVIQNQVQQTSKSLNDLLPPLKTLQLIIRRTSLGDPQEGENILPVIAELKESISLSKPFNPQELHPHSDPQFSPELKDTLREFSSVWNSQCLA